MVQTAVPETHADDTGPVPVVPDAPVGEGVVKRTQYTVTTVDPASGAYSTRHSLRPLHYRDPDHEQEWTPFSNDLREVTGSSRHSYENVRGPFKARFGSLTGIAAGGPLLEVSSEGKSVGIAMPGGIPRSIGRSGSRVSLEDVLPGGIDVRLHVQNERIKEDVLIPSPPAAAPVFNFDLTLTGGLTAVKQLDNSVELRDETGRVWFTMPAPFLLDSNVTAPEQQYSDKVAVTLLDLGGGRVRLGYAPDLVWLQAPSRVYPVTLDPTVTTTDYRADGAQDAHIYECCFTENTAGSTLLHVGANPGGQRRDTLLQFPDLGELPNDSVVTSATLRLYATAGNEGTPMEVRANTGAWTESVTWGSAPTYGLTRYAQKSTTPGWNEIYLNGLTRFWVNQTLANHGVRLFSSNPANLLSTAFVSGDSTDTAHHPELVVTYVPATRYGWSDDWTYVENQYDDLTYSGVNISNGNMTLTHEGGSIEPPGFIVDLSHSYNSQDRFGQTAYYEPVDPAVYGEGWGFSGDERLYAAGDGAMVFRDGQGGGNHSYARNTLQGQVQTYLTPPDYTHALTKDLSKPSTDPQVYKLTPVENDGETVYFDTGGRQTSRENGWGQAITYTYDAADRLARITQADGKYVELTYLGPGNPARLSKLTDNTTTPARVSTYTYDTTGNLTAITRDVGTINEATTTFGYGLAHHLTSVTSPEGKRSNIDYKVQYQFDTAGVTWGWVAEGRATAVSQSTEEWFRGTGSLKVDMSNATTSSVAGIGNYPVPAESWNSNQQELLTYVFVPAGKTVNTRFVLRDSRNVLTYGPWWAANGGATGAWTEIRMPDAHIDPGHKLAKVALQFGGSAAVPYTGSVWVDHMLVKGIVRSFTDDSVPQQTLVTFTYNFDGRSTGITAPGTDPFVQPGTHTYDGFGVLTSEADPVEAYWTPERMATAVDRAAPRASSLEGDMSPTEPVGTEEWFAGGEPTSVLPYESADLEPSDMASMDPNTSTC